MIFVLSKIYKKLLENQIKSWNSRISEMCVFDFKKYLEKICDEGGDRPSFCDQICRKV